MVQIVTDSSVLYTREEAKAAGFEVMPLCISIGDLEDRDMEVDMDVFYGRIANVEIRMLDLGAAFVTQGGPRCVAIQYIGK